MDEDIKFDPEDLKFTFGWCELCGCVFVRCPKCGNNSCNGGRGNKPPHSNFDPDGEPCDICTLTYQYANVFNKTGCLLCDHWRKADGGFCFLTRNLPDETPCKNFTGITKVDGKPLTIDEEKLLNDFFGAGNSQPPDEMP